MLIADALKNDHQDFTDLRHDLHRNPQTCYEEEYASALIQKKLTEWGIDFKSGWAKTGVIATIKGSGKGPTIGLRADMDALDILEIPKHDHGSQISGKMHGCGHDGHTTILLCVAKYLSQNADFNGTVHLIFQPAEEGGGGALQMIDQGLFKTFPCDYIFALHNWPTLPKGIFAISSGPMLAAANTFEITMHGQGGHAAFPHYTNDVLYHATDLVSRCQAIVSRAIDPLESAVLSFTNLNVGSGASNVIAEEAVMNGTIRTFSNDVLAIIKNKLQVICDSYKDLGVEVTLDFTEGYDVTHNHPDAVEIAKAAAAEITGGDKVDGFKPIMGAEDFGAMTSAVPGCMIAVGQGEDDPDHPCNQGLHTPSYDFNDDIIPIGAQWFINVVKQVASV